MTGMGRSVVVIAPANYFRMALQRYLQRLGFDVRVAADLGEAVAEARRVEASLFVLDLNQTVALADLELLRRLSTSGR
jgi:DNA-binding response OmpR family regulator